MAYYMNNHGHKLVKWTVLLSLILGLEDKSFSLIVRPLALWFVGHEKELDTFYPSSPKSNLQQSPKLIVPELYVLQWRRVQPVLLSWRCPWGQILSLWFGIGLERHDLVNNTETEHVWLPVKDVVSRLLFTELKYNALFNSQLLHGLRVLKALSWK